MSTNKNARQFVDVNSKTQTSTTSMFIRNHSNPEHLLAQVEALFVQGQIHEASHVVECIIDNNNALVSSPDLFTLHAKIFIELFGFNVHAQCSIQQALLLDPAHESALELQKLCDLHEDLRDGLYENAEDGLRRTLKNDPKNAYAQYILANHLFWKNGPEAEAIEMLENCVKSRPSFLRAWLCLAMAYKKNQNLAQAEGAFQECMGLDTNASNHEFYKKHLQSI